MRLIALCGLCAARLFAADLSAFAYDHGAPLDPRLHEVAVRNGIRIDRLNFAVSPGVRVDCLLVTPPRGASRTGGIIWMHSSGYFEQLPDALLLAQAGAVSLLIDPIAPDWSAPAAAWPGPMKQAVVSIRRGADLPSPPAGAFAPPCLKSGFRA